MSLVFNMDTGMPGIVGITIVTPPTKTAYEVDDTVDMTGAVIALNLVNGASIPLTSYGYSPSVIQNDTSEITVSYRGFTDSFSVTVGSRVPIPTLAVDPHYLPGYTWTVGTANEWTGYDTTKMSIGGETSGTTIGTYAARFTLNSGLVWEDGTTGAKSVLWSIRKSTADEIILPKSPITVYAGPTSGQFTLSIYSDVGSFSVDTSEVPLLFTSEFNYNARPMTYRMILRETPYSSTSFTIYFTASGTSTCPSMRRQPVQVNVLV